MTVMPILLPLLAQRSNWSRLGDRFSGSHLRFQFEDLLGVLALVGLAIAFLVAMRLLATWQRAIDQPTTPKQLFAELAKAHALSRAERAELRRVAAEAGLDDAADAFLRPDLASRFADRALADRLFGSAT